MSDTAQIARINALTSNARSTWLGLLSVLVFATVTLVSVEHIDFYGTGRGTQLPLVNITVPTYLFFYAAPILIFAIYGYLHLYLIRLWDALSEADPRIDGTRLAEHVSPWLLTDAALALRAALRRDGCAERRETDWTSMVLNILMTWLATPALLAWIWWESMPARNSTMTAVAGLMCAFSLAMASVSLRLLIARMWERRWQPPAFWRITLIYFTSVGTLCAAVLTVTWARTEDPLPFLPTIPLAEIDLQDQRLTDRPSGWLPYAIARREDLAKWCQREEVTPCETDFGDDRMSDDDRRAFAEEWDIKRTAQINDLRKPTHLNRFKVDTVPSTTETRSIQIEVLNGNSNRFAMRFIEVKVPTDENRHQRLDLRGANLRSAFVAGSNLTGAKMTGVMARETDLEGAKLVYADLRNAELTAANLTKVKLTSAQLQEADLSWARLQEANLSGALLQGADLSFAQLQQADLTGAQLQWADISAAQMKEANLNGAQLREEDLK